MPSPFPGMNPYLERDTVFHDFHGRLAFAAAEALTAQIRPRYFAKIDEDIYLHELSAEERRLVGRPDVSVAGTPGLVGVGGPAGLKAPAQAIIPQPVDEIRLPFIELYDRDSNKVITVIEILSPTNKGKLEDRAAYEAKRRRVFRSDVHLVEIDLLRGGIRPPMNDLPQCDYCVMVSRSEDRPRVGVWPIRLHDRLPLIPVPLKTPDPDARLDLQEILNRVYDAAGYEDYVYRGTPQPPLHPADAAWAEELLRAAVRPPGSR